MSSTGSPDPSTSYSSSAPLTVAMSMASPRDLDASALGAPPPGRRERDRYGGNRRGYGRGHGCASVTDRGDAMSETAGPVELARSAAARGDWQEAYDLLAAADAASRLAPGEMPVLAETAYAAGRLDVTIETWERVHGACMQVGDPLGAAGAAVRVALHLLFDTALMAPVRGWLARAERLLEGRGETPAHAWLAVVRTYERMLTGDLPGARPWARRAIELGSKHAPAACAL